MALPTAPDLVHDRAGRPRFGTYQGAFDVVRLDQLDADHALRGLARVRRQKKWVYTFAASEEVALVSAVVDTTYSATSFTLVADLRTREVVADRSFLGSPRPLVAVGPHATEGMECRYVSAAGRTTKRRARGEGSYAVGIALRPAVVTRLGRSRAPGQGGPGQPVQPGRQGVSASLSLDASTERPLSVVAPVDGNGRINVTTKSGALPASGQVRVGPRSYRLDGGFGGFDFTHGYLARRTAWRWAFTAGRAVDGTPVSLNLVEGFNEARDDVNENGLWLGGRLIPLDRARFSFDASDPMKPWQVRTLDGSVDLTFDVIGVHEEHRNLGVVKSMFVQPIGLFTGTIRVDGTTYTVENLPGVTEDQDVIW